MTTPLRATVTEALSLAVWQQVLAFFLEYRANEVQVRPFGLPFPMVWQMAGIVLSTLVIGLVLALDRRGERRRKGAE
jgi:hypothetical protein